MFRSGWNLVPLPGLMPSLRYWTYSTGVSQGELIGSGFKGSMRLRNARAGRTCQHCGKAIEAARSTRRFCSDICRVKAHREAAVRDTLRNLEPRHS